ncbi:chemotaxis protein CheW [Shewanella litorisediminis]|uniref:Chemotaxis protein CheW n=1 Tax=Shewanella litorisediminis TaxID=1173586 RepID=A0ABX7FZU1_9GAMM|nr:chemotaxis protein CheW [Shewanella litorisediminis]MCL2919656.1 chemotaxis protein CheW [Shewanella litorisediminis]QRH00544.1 chemotaxis protein CheW [Shewanella litorisediminis]
MSKSVDETVVDFFRLLLSEDAQASAQTVLTDVSTQDSPVLPREVFVSNTIADARPADSIVSDKKTLPTGDTTSARNMPASEQSMPASAKHESVTVKPESAQQSQRVAPGLDPLDKASLEKLLAPVFDVVKPVEQPAIEQPAIEKKTASADSKPVVAEAAFKAKIEVRPQVQEKIQAKAAPEAAQQVAQVTPVQSAPQTQTGATPPSITKDLREELDDEFQVLFFKVAGLTLAVPLVSLGGIVKVERINHIFGRPDWFLGVQTHRESQLNLVDTCAWVMPEKYNEELAQNVNYQYLVLLEDSNWGLACESLVNSVRIKQSQVNWRTTAGKRPWLAGVVKEQMCGILNVRALIQMLNAGLGCQDPIS